MDAKPSFRTWLGNVNGTAIRGINLYVGFSDEIAVELKNGNYDHVTVDFGDWQSLNFLSEYCPDLTSLRCNFEAQDVSGIMKLAKLKNLQMDNCGIKGKLSFASFQLLERCSIKWSKTCSYDLFHLPGLKDLSLYKFSGNFSDVAKAKGLTELLVSQGTIENLEGVNDLSCLSKLTLYGLRNLINIGALSENSSIEAIHIEACNQINDLSPVGSMPSLRKVALDLKEIPSLSVLEPGENIEFIHLAGTKLSDDNVGRCMNFPKLERILFRDRKTYTHKFDDIDIALEKRLGRVSTYMR